MTHCAGFAAFGLSSSVASSFAMVALLAVRSSPSGASSKEAGSGSAHKRSGGADASALVVLNGEAGSWKGGKGGLGLSQRKGSRAAAEEELAGGTAERQQQRILEGSWHRMLAGVAAALMLLLAVTHVLAGEAHLPQSPKSCMLLACMLRPYTSSVG